MTSLTIPTKKSYGEIFENLLNKKQNYTVNETLY